MRGKKLKMELIINVVIKTKLFKTKTKTKGRFPLPEFTARVHRPS